MKKIILASASVQRQNLLKRLGIPLCVEPSHIREKSRIRTTCADLVKENALQKATDVAGRTTDSIVIGADTLVYLGGKTIVGKPKDLKEAQRILRRLFAQPHWVYTGLAVIDTQTGRQMVDYEKTKVFMTHLSNEEIERYHNKVSPLDKAGGFDIEGHGALFIRRIEGCYFNVIGLPMAKLFQMLKKMGVHLLGLVLLLGLFGCATEYNLATGKHETLLYGTDKEVSIGNSLSRQFDKHYKYVEDVDTNERVQRILDCIVAVCDRQELVYSIRVIDEDKLNAVSLPGGYVYVFKGLLDKLKTDDQLAGVIGHEVGHITARHAIKKLQSMYGYTLLQIATIGSGNAQMAPGLDAAFTSVFLEYSQQDEFQADQLGIKYARKAGFNPAGMGEALAILKAEEDKEPGRPFSYWRTHPHLSQRISQARADVKGQLEFRDYLNLTGER